MRRSVVPVSGQRVLAGQRLLIAEQQRFMAGVECGALQLRNGFGVDPAGRHEVQRLADAVGKVLILLEHGGATHEIQRPGVELVQIGIAALREGAQPVERSRRLRIRSEESRVGKEWVSQCRSRGTLNKYKKKDTKTSYYTTK